MYGQYRCRKSNKSRVAEPCKNSQVSENQLENRIWPRIYEFLNNPRKFLHELQEREHRQEGTVELRSKQKGITDRLLTLQRERERVCYLYEKGIGYQTEGEVELRFQEIEEEQKRLKVEEQQLCKRVLTREQQRERLQSASEISKRFKKSLNKADFALKKQIIQLLVQRIVISTQAVRVELKIPKEQAKPDSKSVFLKNEIQTSLGGDPGGN